MKKNILSFFIVIFLFSGWRSSAQDVTTISANSEDISDNLDLEAVASIFGDSKDLEDFEKRLNDPKTQISNLDLNNDGDVDNLRIMETEENNVHSIHIQAVLGKDQYQEVAVNDVEKDTKGTTQVQVVGNVDMYGPNYYISPYYPVVAVFFTLFWVASYRPWYSPWYWGGPPYFRPWRPYPPHIYRSNVHVNIHNTYNRNNVRMNKRTTSNTRNNSYFKNNPDKSFNKWNPGNGNRNELVSDRKARPANTGINNDKGYKSTSRPVQKPATSPSKRPNKNPVTDQQLQNQKQDLLTQSQVRSHRIDLTLDRLVLDLVQGLQAQDQVQVQDNLRQDQALSHPATEELPHGAAIQEQDIN